MKGWVVLLVLACAGCGSRQGVYDKVYLDLDSLINVQVEALSAQPVRVEKRSGLGDKTSVTTMALDSLAFQQEMEVFRQLDAINKPGFANDYRVEAEDDPHSNLQVRVYKGPSKATVPEVKLYFLNDLVHLKKIEGRVVEHNALYTSERHLQLTFDDRNGIAQLSGYKVTGMQKMALRDSVMYRVESQILQ